MPFEVFTNQKMRQVDECRVTCSRSGLLYLNKASITALGHPGHVLLLFDSERRIIAIQPSDADNSDAYVVTSQKGQGGNIGCAAFTRYCGIPRDIVHYFSADMVNGMLCFSIEA